MKDHGCEWVGKLEDLQAHLLVDTNNCQYMDIQCPDKCGESVPRHQLPSHLANSCKNRHYFCKYCNFSASYRVVCYDHWPKCPLYPVQCPNACSVGAVERGDLEDHIKVCLLQEVSCELSHAGCKETFLREDEDRHMEENTQKHLLLMSAMSQRMCREFEQKLQEQREEKASERKRMQQMLDESKQEREEQITRAREEFEQKLQEQREKREREVAEVNKKKDDEVIALRVEVEALTHQLQVQGIVQLQHIPNRCTPPVCFTMNNFNELKTDGREWIGPDLYTHEHGYKMYFVVRPTLLACRSTHVSVLLYTKPGEFDDQLKWPVEATITLQLLNRYRDEDHITLTNEWKWSKPTQPTYLTCWHNAISHTDLEWNGRKRTQYLKNDCLAFRLTRVIVTTAHCKTF